MKKPVKAITHKDAKRAHIPSGEEAGYESGSARVQETPDPRAFSLNPIVHRGADPELNWLDKYNRPKLTVPVRSLYRHEHIAPEALIRGLYRVVAEERADSPELFSVNELFGNALAHEELDKVSDYYTHSDGWTNRLIQGDSLLGMTSLLEREGMAGQVQCCYFDPPYGIKYGSNWQIRLNSRTVTDGQDDSLSGEPEQIKAFRDTWELGIHSYLSYLRDRLLVARELLHDSGSCFVQISDENVHLVRCLMDEVFGSANFCSLISFYKTGGQTNELLAANSDYVLWYAKDREHVKFRPLYKEKTARGAYDNGYAMAEFPDGSRRRITPAEREDLEGLAKQGIRLFKPENLTSAEPRPSTTVPFVFEGKTFHPGKNRHWRVLPASLEKLVEHRRLIAIGNTLAYVQFLEDFAVTPTTSTWLDTGIAGFASDKVYVVQTNAKVIQRCILMTTDPGDLVLDPTCGSGTTAYVAEQWGRRWITTDTSRIALNIAKTRLMTATFPFYHLYDSEEGRRLATTMNRAVGAPPPWGAEPGASPQAGMKGAVGAGESDAKSGVGAADSVSAKGAAHTSLGQRPRKPTDETPSAESASHLPGHNVRYGFVYKKVPHITLGSIANNEPPAEETLYDQPLEDKKRLRVAGPFTVETLQSYEPISPEELARQREQVEELAAFEDLIFEHLKSAGVKTGDKSEQAVFTRIDRLSSTELHAEGFYETAGGEKKAYLHIGPKFGTVSKQAVNEAIKACRGRHDADWLMILGFAFESGLSDVTTKDFGSFKVSIVRMHDDLLQEGLLKKDKKAASFVTIGEPDIRLNVTQASRLSSPTNTGGTPVPLSATVEIAGLDIYDPIRDEVKSRDVHDIAYWMLDDDYDGSNFVVRQVFFCGGDKDEFDQWKKELSNLAAAKTKKAAEQTLKIEIDDEAFAHAYGHQSRPFHVKKSQKVAVRVVSQFGEETTKVLLA